MTTKDNELAHIVKHLEDLAVQIFDAIDRRDLDHTLPVWDILHPDFKIDVEHIDKPYRMGKEEHMVYMKDLIAQNPDYTTRVTGATTKVNPKIGSAESFLNMETAGLARMPGVTRETLAIYTWRQVEGKWYLIAAKSLSGLAP